MIEEIYNRVRSLFIFVPDKEQFGVIDDWRSHADEVDAGKVFRDDCDGFAMTCAELLVRAGFQKSLINLCLCTTETGEGHLVCVAEGKVMDNRQRGLWNWNELPYIWLSRMNMGNIGVWEKII